MITSSDDYYERYQRSQRQRNFEIAVVVSLLLHFLLGLFFWHNWAFVRHLMDRTSAKTDIATVQTIKIERRPIPPPPAPKTQVVQPKVEPVHTDPVVPQLPVPKALEEPPRPQVHQRSEVTHLALHAPPRAHDPAGSPRRSTQLGEAQLAQLQNEFKQTISQAQAQTAAQQSASTAVASIAVAPKHYAMSFSGIHDSLRHGEGTIGDCKTRQHGSFNYHYYCHYEYMYADGHVEEDTIPWPQIYKVGADPLSVPHATGIQILEPPDGFKPDRPLQPLLRQFFTHEQVAP